MSIQGPSTCLPSICSPNDTDVDALLPPNWTPGTTLVEFLPRLRATWQFWPPRLAAVTIAPALGTWAQSSAENLFLCLFWLFVFLWEDGFISLFVFVCCALLGGVVFVRMECPAQCAGGQRLAKYCSCLFQRWHRRRPSCAPLPMRAMRFTLGSVPWREPGLINGVLIWRAYNGS